MDGMRLMNRLFSIQLVLENLIEELMVTKKNRLKYGVTNELLSGYLEKTLKLSQEIESGVCNEKYRVFGEYLSGLDTNSSREIERN